MTQFIAPQTLLPHRAVIPNHNLLISRDCKPPVITSKDSNCHRQILEDYISKRINGHSNIDSDDFQGLNNNELQILYEVYHDLERYKLNTSMIEVPPSEWNQRSWSSWIHFISQKYVDNFDVDMSRGESEGFKRILRQYWESQETRWAMASAYNERVCQNNKTRNKFEEMQTVADLLDLKSTNPQTWNAEENAAFCQHIKVKYKLNSEEELAGVYHSELEVWYKVHLRMHQNIVYSHVPQNVYSNKPSEYADPEDWDRSALNAWLESVTKRFNIPPICFSERHCRLLMIYVRCAWPHDELQVSFNGLKKMFHNNERIAELLYRDILALRSPHKQQETSTKTESQRHRNRRDLHLWEFLLILLANPEFERASIHWKSKEEGKFELSERNKVAKMWGLTKGNTKMNYDNMSRSVRQYYKDTNTGIMIRHQPGKPSFGKYSYQFFMENAEVKKLWDSLK